MVNLGFWQLATDVLLLCSLVYLSFQFVRSPRINAQLRAVRELEGALRVLVREADGAGRSLNDQLMRRQQALEKALIDADLAEQRITKLAAQQQAEVSRPVAAPVTPPVPEAAPVAANSKLRRSIEVEPSEPPVEWKKVNIYGEPIAAEAISESQTSGKVPGRAQQRAMRTYSPLKAQVQKEVSEVTEPEAPKRSMPKPPKQPPAAQQAEAAIEDVYLKAEELLRAGDGLAQVASQTNLPISEIRALSQMIIGERAVAQNKEGHIAQVVDEDPRLGVMSTMKRQTITL
jgi:hypothetical protein